MRQAGKYPTAGGASSNRRGRCGTGRLEGRPAWSGGDDRPPGCTPTLTARRTGFSIVPQSAFEKGVREIPRGGPSGVRRVHAEPTNGADGRCPGETSFEAARAAIGRPMDAGATPHVAKRPGGARAKRFFARIAAGAMPLARWAARTILATLTDLDITATRPRNSARPTIGKPRAGH